MTTDSRFSYLYEKVLKEKLSKSYFVNTLFSSLENSENVNAQEIYLKYLNKFTLEGLEYYKILENLVVSHENDLIRFEVLSLLIKNYPTQISGLLDWLIKSEDSDILFLKLERLLRRLKKPIFKLQYMKLLKNISEKIPVVLIELFFYLDLIYQRITRKQIDSPVLELKNELITESTDELKEGTKIFAIQDGYTIGLNLSDFLVDFLPETIKDLSKLEILIIKKNQLTKIPNSIGGLKTLRFLDISKNKLYHIPDIFNGMNHLSYVNLNRNYNLESVPKSLKNIVKKLICRKYKQLGVARNEAYVLGLFEILTGRTIEKINSLKEFNFTNTRYKTNFKINKKQNIEALYLCNPHFFRIPFIPQEIGELEFLRTLEISENDIKSLPKSVQNLTQLREINLKLNKIQKFPLSITKTKSIEKINFSFNFIDTIPQKIEDLEKIEYLNLKHNQIEKIPSELGQLGNLKFLDLSYNEIKYIPDEIGDLQNLSYLKLSHNRLMKIPHSIENLRSLKLLDLSYNNIREVPNIFHNLDSLEQLELNCNQFYETQQDMGHIKNLKYIDLRVNSFEQFQESKMK
ncbi:MAG: hypothetical protein BAJALOKI2v1_490002 [Promethearchaeota archaeon]|nr:MAG: hypothetical protein BAJALOKI2v1_490002 [Candidatus Lokiarchaeota archaeon]